MDTRSRAKGSAKGRTKNEAKSKTKMHATGGGGEGSVEDSGEGAARGARRGTVEATEGQTKARAGGQAGGQAGGSAAGDGSPRPAQRGAAGTAPGARAGRRVVPATGGTPPPDVVVVDTSDEPGGAVVTSFVPRERDARLKRYEPLLPGSVRRGGGPSSAEGRAVASRNALTHGAYAVVPQSLPAYQDHERQVQMALNPVGALEDSIAQEVAVATWRRDLLARHERSHASMIEGLEPPLSQVALHSGFPFGERHHHLLACGVDSFRLRRELAALWRGHLYLAASGGLGLAREGVAVFGRRPVSPEREEEFMRRWDEAVALAPHSGGGLHAALQSEPGEAFQARLWAYRNWAAVGAARALLVSRAVIEFLGSHTLGRARALIDRSVRDGMQALEQARSTASRGRFRGVG